MRLCPSYEPDRLVAILTVRTQHCDIFAVTTLSLIVRYSSAALILR